MKIRPPLSQKRLGGGGGVSRGKALIWGEGGGIWLLDDMMLVSRGGGLISKSEIWVIQIWITQLFMCGLIWNLKFGLIEFE